MSCFPRAGILLHALDVRGWDAHGEVGLVRLVRSEVGGAKLPGGGDAEYDLLEGRLLPPVAVVSDQDHLLVVLPALHLEDAVADDVAGLRPLVPELLHGVSRHRIEVGQARHRSEVWGGLVHLHLERRVVDRLDRDLVHVLQLAGAVVLGALDGRVEGRGVGGELGIDGPLPRELVVLRRDGRAIRPLAGGIQLEGPGQPVFGDVEALGSQPDGLAVVEDLVETLEDLIDVPDGVVAREIRVHAGRLADDHPERLVFGELGCRRGLSDARLHKGKQDDADEECRHGSMPHSHPPAIRRADGMPRSK